MIAKKDYSKLDWGNLKSGGSVGMLPKTVTSRGKTDYYVKMSAYNKVHGVYGIESISEVIASRLARIMKIPCVSMRLIDALVVKDGRPFNTYVCVSPEYKLSGETVVPFETDYDLNHLKDETTLDYAKRIGITDEVYKMFIFDYVIANLDRHGANVELYEATHKMAPLFDNGNSLYATRDESEVIRLGFYPGDDSMSSNFIGSRSLLENVKSIDRIVEIGNLRREDRTVLFKDLSGVISRERRDAIWELVIRRYENARAICHFKTI